MNKIIDQNQIERTVKLQCFQSVVTLYRNEDGDLSRKYQASTGNSVSLYRTVRHCMSFTIEKVI